MISLGWSLLLMFQSAPAQEAVSPLPRIQASVVLVRGATEGRPGRQGSGVVVAPRIVATNAHVIESSQGLTVRQGATVWPATVLRVDQSRDLCLLSVPGLMVAPVVLAPEPSEPGQPVVAAGFPGGQGPTLSKGHLRGIWHQGENLLLQSDALTSPGSSGGGLFDEEGRLLGLTTMTFTPDVRMNFSIPAAWVEALALAPPGEPVSALGWDMDLNGAGLLEKLARDPRNWPAWEVASRQWVQDLPQDPDAWLALGLALDQAARSAKLDQSGPVLLQAVEAYRRSLALRRDAKTLNNLGVALDSLNRFDEAEQVLSEAVEREPAYAVAWLNRAATHFNAGRFDQAAEAFRSALALRPDEVDAWARLAFCQRRLGQGEAAVASLRIALRYRPLAAEMWLELGLLLVDLVRFEDARVVHERLEALNPELATRLQAALNRDKALRKGRSTKG
ncbi:tetratricopeptide repeat-containing serine protease family protein [Geothrix sp. PMB-07]|uniref:tetratricopeptide repeat-containing S1 family peptidase n=1 Tax=Geothrix sp. PMB-07 TaxID=3068640 RepID=UPI00274139FA|nr:tetratricopeptide repeat-containing serine protease family protein [Geothrix sp. PMB-07]WLT32085.1 tetratricopeptide repeat-containing serine protease family protein [Geothrix sp. PMB-07]